MVLFGMLVAVLRFLMSLVPLVDVVFSTISVDDDTPGLIVPRRPSLVIVIVNTSTGGDGQGK